ncbi:hypothetical protein M0802_016327 [Mischocyttarus mexicanus]|nr:hypothetical protein M0802_016327 [Mischocyttarus mexicanus]
MKRKSKAIKSVSRSNNGVGRERRPEPTKAKKAHCFSCGSPDHSVKQCSALGKGSKCFRCSEFGHIARECQKRVNLIIASEDVKSVMTQGKECMALVDSGSDLTLLREDKVTEIGSVELTKTISSAEQEDDTRSVSGENAEAVCEEDRITLIAYNNLIEHLGRLCIIPEASQESILQPFTSYSDVAMFHFNVPKEILRATWQFAAFMDQPNCPQRKVHIHLRWGSYPVLPIDNMTFPTNMYPHNNDTLVITTDTYFEPKSIAVIPVYGPQAGDWFVAAYLSHWDKKVQQQGLFHKCHYSIGSIALWEEVSAIKNVPVGYQVTLKTKETSSYYKIYVPSGISTLRVYIWGCNSTVHSFRNIHKPCIKNVALQGRVLPVFNNTPSSNIGNLTMMDSYMFTISSPYEDSYYYLLIISDSIIEFNIKVSLSECPIKLIEKQNIGEYSSITEKFTQISEINVKQNETIVSNRNRSLSYNLMDLYKSQFYVRKDNSDPEDKCFQRYQLVRVKHSQIFSTSYLLQGKEWLTPWLALTDSYPIITQFNILPFVDIGGTLDINVHLEIYEVRNFDIVKIIEKIIYIGV